MLEFLITRIVKLKHCFELINNIVWSFQSWIRAFSTTCCIISNITLHPGPFVTVVIRAISRKALSLSDACFLKHGLAGRRDFPNLQLKWHRNRQAALQACFPHFLSCLHPSPPRVQVLESCSWPTFKAKWKYSTFIQSEIFCHSGHGQGGRERERERRKKPCICKSFRSFHCSITSHFTNTLTQLSFHSQHLYQIQKKPVTSSVITAPDISDGFLGRQ